MKKKLFILIFLNMLLLTLTFTLLEAQSVLRDSHGNEIHQTWPPADSLYEHYKITVWFNKNTINQQFLCDYWYNLENLKPKKNQDKPLDDFTVACFPIDSQLITDTNVINVLLNLGATQMCQYTNFSPCEDTLSFSRNGDTIRTPQFWNCFSINLDSDNVIQAVPLILYLFGGKQIDFAELIPVVKSDYPSPQDIKWNEQTNFHNIPGYCDWGCNLLDAWDIAYGNRAIKVAVIDDGICFMHPDFGGGIGPNKSITDGRMYIDEQYLPIVNGGEHGTKVAGQLCAINNNNLCISSIAGPWCINYNEQDVTRDGVSVIDCKCPNWSFKSFFNAWIDAAAFTSGGKGFGVNVINYSWGGKDYSEYDRRAVDYAYRMNVINVCSKGEGDFDPPKPPDYEIKPYLHYPADYDYNEVIAVGAYGINLEYANVWLNHWIPTRARGSNYGYGLDVLACGVVYGSTCPLVYWTLGENSTGVCDDVDSDFGLTSTSFAAPQVAAVAGLILSNDYMNRRADFQVLFPEDVEGLIDISALDCRWQFGGYTQDKDTIGYDANTGYGILRADMPLSNMLMPYQLKHFPTVGNTINEGTSVEQVEINPFWVLAPDDGSAPLLAPSSNLIQYRAIRHRIQKEILINEWDVACSWGNNSHSTGWSASQPIGAEMNRAGRRCGYTRVIGDGNYPYPDPNFNNNNIRDISYNNSWFTLETFCYDVYQKIPGFPDLHLGWYPDAPGNLNFSYSIWGLPAPTDVNEKENLKYTENGIIKVRCESNYLLNENRVFIHYKMEKPGPVSIEIYDNLGRIMIEKTRSAWAASGVETISINIDDLVCGVYIAVIRSSNSAGSCSFLVVK